ncbi:MAG TPA: methyltransferase domain-containing protein [Bacteroidia bacterium]|nr:methyltransferase domain-containing protein [Bacteroidia bacterium]
MKKEPDHNDAKFWQQHYENGSTQWDAGAPTEPLRHYFEGLTDKSINILIPGAGNGWEAGWLFNNGFKNVYVLDFAAAPLEHFKKRIPEFPSSHLINENFFSHKGNYDLIVEQTFFCAIDPSLRRKYAEHMSSLLNKGGRLAGLLFNFPLETGPPFGGNAKEYESLFKPLFHIKVMAPCYNSIAPRMGRELFVIFEKKG